MSGLMVLRIYNISDSCQQQMVDGSPMDKHRSARGVTAPSNIQRRDGRACAVAIARGNK